MDVINFSGGGPQIDPANDALVEAIHNVAAAGVVPVIAAGNDRDDFGLGSAGSPGTAPDAISVAAVSNTHVFAPALDVTAPATPVDAEGHPVPRRERLAARPPPGRRPTRRSSTSARSPGATRSPSNATCAALPGNLASPTGQLPPDSLDRRDRTRRARPLPVRDEGGAGKGRGSRSGSSSRTTARARRTGSRPGSRLPGGMIANLDGDNLRAYLTAHGGRTTVQVGHDPLELETGRSGVITSFSSGGPTAFGHDLKPDISAPGGQILSSTLPNTSASRFAVFDGTSMATPHVAAAAALLLELHPGWTPAEVKSALVSTAAAAWGDTARTQEAPVTLEGGGLVSLPARCRPEALHGSGLALVRRPRRHARRSEPRHC